MKRSYVSRQPTVKRGSRRGTLSSKGKKLALAVAVHCDDEAMRVRFDDGRELTAPLLPFLREASARERRKCRVRAWGTELYWPDLDEVVGVNYVLGVPEDELLDYAGFTRPVD